MILYVDWHCIYWTAFFFYCPAQTGGSGGSGDTSLGGSLPPLNKSLGGNGDVTMAQGLGISMGKYGLGNKWRWTYWWFDRFFIIVIYYSSFKWIQHGFLNHWKRLFSIDKLVVRHFWQSLFSGFWFPLTSSSRASLNMRVWLYVENEWGCIATDMHLEHTLEKKNWKSSQRGCSKYGFQKK
jgi:hypothetical protein